MPSNKLAAYHRSCEKIQRIMKRRIRNKIFFTYAIATTLTIISIVLVVFWKINQNATAQEIFLRDGLSDQANSNVRSYHYFTQSTLSKDQHELKQFAETLLRNSSLAVPLFRLQTEAIVDLLQQVGPRQGLDFSLIFSQDGLLRASFGGQKGFRPGDLNLPRKLQDYRAFPFLQKAHEILQQENRFQISPEESVALEQSLELNGFTRLDRQFIQELGIKSNKDAIAMVSAGLIRDEFSMPVGVLIVGRLLNDFGELFGKLHEETPIASTLFIGTTPVSFAGFQRDGQRKTNNFQPEISPDQNAAVYSENRPTDVFIFYGQERYYSTCSPIKDILHNNVGLLCTGLPESLIQRVQNPILNLGKRAEKNLIKWVLGICLFMTFISTILARFLAKGITKPLEELVHFTSQVEGKDLSRRITNLAPDETGVLGQSINGMLDKLAAAQEEKEKMENQLRQSHKLEAIGILAGGIAHDFNNLLAIIFGYAQLAQLQAPKDSGLTENLKNILTAANRAKDLVRQILSFSRQAKVDRFPLDLTSLVKESLKMLRASLPATIEIRNNLNPQCGLVLADPTQIHQIIMNLCTNAHHAMEKNGGILDIQLRHVSLEEKSILTKTDLKPGEYVELVVSDTGTGIRPDLVDKIFDPYFTTKEQGKGTGMGLAIVHGLVKEYGGGITVESTSGRGTTCRIFLPVVDEKPLLPNVTKPSQVLGGTERVLFVDDERLLANIGKDVLEPLGYKVTVRENSHEALATFQSSPDAFDVVVTDQTMPGMTGIVLAQKILQIRPDIPIILCTGYSNLADEDSAKRLGIREFAYKPLTQEAIISLIRKVLDE